MKYRAASMIVFLCFSSVGVVPMVAAGQDEAAMTEVNPNDDTIEDVGQKSLSELRRDVYEAEEDFYSLYNKLNDDKEYDVRCFYENPTGTRVKNHVCRARFVTKAYAVHARRNRNDLSRVANQDAIPVPAEKKAKYEEKMETLIADNPDLAAAFARYNTARVRFFAKREEIDKS